MKKNPFWRAFRLYNTGSLADIPKFFFLQDFDFQGHKIIPQQHHYSRHIVSNWISHGFLATSKALLWKFRVKNDLTRGER